MYLIKSSIRSVYIDKTILGTGNYILQIKCRIILSENSSILFQLGKAKLMDMSLMKALGNSKKKGK